MDLTIIILSAILSLVVSLFLLILKRILNRLDHIDNQMNHMVTHDEMREYTENRLSSLESANSERKERIAIIEAKIDRLMEMLIQLRIDYESKNKR